MGQTEVTIAAYKKLNPKLSHMIQPVPEIFQSAG